MRNRQDFEEGVDLESTGNLGTLGGTPYRDP